MRILGAALLLVSSMVVGVGWLLPATAQDPAATSSPHNLPATDFQSGASAAHSFGAAPGFADASIPINPNAPDAQPIGQGTCVACHSGEAANFAHTTHALGMEAARAANPAAATCEACHGPGSQHQKTPSVKGAIISFNNTDPTPRKVQNETCMGCHNGGPRDAWLGSVHERGQVGCSDCHNPMAKFSSEGLTAKQSVSETCATCHKDIRQQFNRRSHMPLPEGQMSCVDCHNPHGTINASLLKTDTVNETCYQCHAEKRGPFLFEHAPVRDSCLNCHTPHGSNQHALLVAPVPMLCQQCHTMTRHPNDLITNQNLGGGAAPDERVLARGCISCHAQVHGSNHPSGPRLHK